MNAHNFTYELLPKTSVVLGNIKHENKVTAKYMFIG